MAAAHLRVRLGYRKLEVFAVRYDPIRLLFAYSLALTVGVGAVGVMAAAPRTATFEEIDVQRLNVREPDGRLRLVLSDKARFPGAIMRGREIPFDRASAGMLFYNDEATEDGGLIFSGQRDPDGRVKAGGSLTFDQYEQDQVVQVSQDEDGQDRRAGIGVFDRPAHPLDLASGMKLRRDPAALKVALASGAFGHRRAFVGKTEDGDSELELRDGEGRPRLKLTVDPRGAAEIAFLDTQGRTIKRIGAM